MSNKDKLSALEAPQSTPKSFEDLKIYLESIKSTLPEDEYNRISSDIDASQNIGVSNMDTYMRIRVPMILKEVESAQNTFKAKKVAKQTTEIRTPVIAAAKSGDKKAGAALKTVDILTEKKNNEKVDATESIKKETPPRVAKLHTEVRADRVLRDIRSRFDDRLNFNDALSIVLSHANALDAFWTNDTFLSSENKESRLTKFLDEEGYIARSRFRNGQNNYSNTELQAVLELRDTLKTSPALAKTLNHNTRIQRAVRIDESLKTEAPAKKMLAELLDFNKDGTLTTYNQKDRNSNILVGGLQKLLDLGKDTQMVSAPELMAYQAFSSQVKTEKDVYNLIGKRLGKPASQIEADWSDENKRTGIIEQFQRAYLLEVTQSNTTVASKIDASKDIARYQAEKVNEQVRQIERIKDALKKEGLIARVSQELAGAGLPKLDATNMGTLLEQIALRVYEINPQLFASVGVNGAVNENTLRTTTNTFDDHTSRVTTNTHTTERHTVNTIVRNIHIVQDVNWNEVSRRVSERPGPSSQTTIDRGTTSTSSSTTERTQTGSKTTEEKKRETKITPTLVIGLNQDIVGYKSEKFNAQVGVGASALVGVDGIVFPITASASGNLTVANDNAQLQSSELRGNFVLGARLSLSKALNGKNKDLVPSLGFDINPNDRLNAIEKQNIRLENLLEKIEIREDGTLNISPLEEILKQRESEANKKDPKDTSLLSEISLMRRFLADTAKVLEEMPKEDGVENVRQRRLLIIRNNLGAYKNAYKEAILMNNQGYSVAGLNITFIPGISAVFLGLNVQNVVAKAKKVGRDSIEAKMSTRAISFDEINSRYPNTLELDTDMISLNVSSDAIARGQISLQDLQITDISASVKKVTPQEGYKLRFQQVENITAEGIATRWIIIDQISVEKSEQRVVSATSAMSESGRKIEDIYNSWEFSKTERDKLFVLSRTNKSLISALNSIVAGEYGKAKAQISMGWPELHFIFTKIASGNDDQKVLTNLILATSGSRGIRQASNLTYAQMITEQRKNESAFMRLLPKDMSETSRVAYKKTQAELNTGEKITEKVSLAPLSTLVGPGYRDIAGTVSFSQIGNLGGKNQRTLAGLFQFSGDMQVLGKSAEVTDSGLKATILADTMKSGAFQRNLVDTNKFLEQNGVTRDLQFTEGEYKSYLLTGELPAKLTSILDVPNRPKFLATRAALPGATCFNDVFCLAFPLIAVKGRERETMVVGFGDRSPTGTYMSTSDVLRQDGGGSSGTIGLNFSRTVKEQVVNQVVDKVTNSVTDRVINRENPIDTTRTDITEIITIERPPVVGGGTWTTPGGVQNPGGTVVIPGAPGTGVGSTGWDI